MAKFCQWIFVCKIFAKPPIPVVTFNHSFVSLPLPSLQWRCQYIIWDTTYCIFIALLSIDQATEYYCLIYTLPPPSLHWRWGEDKAMHGGRVRAGMCTYGTFLVCSTNSCINIFYTIYLLSVVMSCMLPLKTVQSACTEVLPARCAL